MAENRPWSILANSDPQIHNLIEKELHRQKDGIELIASENMASEAVICAAANVLTNKYAEGLPGKRYYGGCEHVDELEEVAKQRAQQLFKAQFSNVQPHSGAQANTAVCLTLLKPGDSILGLDLSHGGHLTHGSPVNFSGLVYQAHFYHVDPNSGRIDYETLAERARETKPKVIIAGASAYPRIIDFPRMREIADEVGAYLWVDMAHIAGLVATGLHPHPLPHAHVVTTTTHKTLRGPRGGLILWNDEKLNFNKGVFPGTQGGPLEHIIAAKAVCFKEAMEESFVAYQKDVLENSAVLANTLLSKGFGLVSGGTDNHLCLVDLSETDVTGKAMEQALEKAGITTNKNTVPNEKRSPFVTSGLRLGTPAVTTRGMKKAQMEIIGGWISEVFENYQNESALQAIRRQVSELCQEFPLYPQWPTS